MIKLEMKNYNIILREKHQKYQLYRLGKLTNMSILQAKKDKPFETQIKSIEEPGKKQIDAITNQNKKLEALTNKDGGHKDKEIFNELIKEIFDKIIKLTDEIKQNDSIYYFKDSIARNRFDDFNDSMKLFGKVRSGQMKLEKAKKLQNVFISKMNEISKGKFLIRRATKCIKKN